MRYFAATYQTTQYKSTSLHSLVTLLRRLGAGPVFIMADAPLMKKQPKDWITITTIEEEDIDN